MRIFAKDTLGIALEGKKEKKDKKKSNDEFVFAILSFLAIDRFINRSIGKDRCARRDSVHDLSVNMQVFVYATMRDTRNAMEYGY